MREFELRLQTDFSKLQDPETGIKLIPAIVQEESTLKVLMVGFMNKEAFDKTVELGKVTFWSRTRRKIWTKGETSENFLEVVSLTLDCDDDTLLIKTAPKGPTCHIGNWSCFDKS